MTSSDREPPAKTKASDVLEAMDSNVKSVRETSIPENLVDRIDAVELLIEEVALARELQKATADYIADLRADLIDMRNFRWWATTFSISAACLLFAVLLYVIIGSPDWFAELEGKFQFSTLLSLGAGSVLLFSLILRGLYRSRQERNQDELLPDHLKFVLEAAQRINGK